MRWKDYIGTLDTPMLDALKEPQAFAAQSRRDAKALRARYYKFRLAVRDAALAGDEEAKTLYRDLRRVSLRLDNNQAGFPFLVMSAKGAPAHVRAT